MSVAYFIVLDNDQADFDPFVNGKAIAHAFDELRNFCETNGLKTIENFHSQDVGELMEGFDDMDIPDIDLPEQEALWFDAQEGIDWINALLQNIENQKPGFATEEIVEELREYLQVFEKSKSAGARWHLEMDF